MYATSRTIWKRIWRVDSKRNRFLKEIANWIIKFLKLQILKLKSVKTVNKLRETLHNTNKPVGGEPKKVFRKPCYENYFPNNAHKTTRLGFNFIFLQSMLFSPNMQLKKNSRYPVKLLKHIKDLTCRSRRTNAQRMIRPWTLQPVTEDTYWCKQYMSNSQGLWNLRTWNFRSSL